MKTDIYNILFWITFIVAVITILGYIFGDSPTMEQGLLILILSFLFKIQANVVSNSLEIKNLKLGSIRLAEDFKDHIKNHSQK